MKQQPPDCEQIEAEKGHLQIQPKKAVAYRFILDCVIAFATCCVIAVCLFTAHSRIKCGGYFFWVSLSSILVAALILVVCLLDMRDGVVKTGGDYMDKNQGTKTNKLMDRLRGREWFKLRGLPFYRRGALLCFIVLFLVAYLTPILRDLTGILPALLFSAAGVYFSGLLLVKITLPNGQEI